MSDTIKVMHTRKGFVAQVLAPDGSVRWQSSPVRNPEVGADGRVINSPSALAARAAEHWLAEHGEAD